MSKNPLQESWDLYFFAVEWHKDVTIITIPSDDDNQQSKEDTQDDV